MHFRQVVIGFHPKRDPNTSLETMYGLFLSFSFLFLVSLMPPPFRWLLDSTEKAIPCFLCLFLPLTGSAVVAGLIVVIERSLIVVTEDWGHQHRLRRVTTMGGGRPPTSPIFFDFFLIFCWPNLAVGHLWLHRHRSSLSDL